MKGLDWRITAALGAALWGGWALYANWDAGVASATRSAITQAVISATSISFLSLLANWVLARNWPNAVIQVIASTLIPYGILLSVVIISHVVVGTHNIVRTIAPSATLGISYLVLYTIKNRRRAEPPVDAGAPSLDLT